jgi:hypothetical protein
MDDGRRVMGGSAGQAVCERVTQETVASPRGRGTAARHREVRMGLARRVVFFVGCAGVALLAAGGCSSAPVENEPTASNAAAATIGKGLGNPNLGNLQVDCIDWPSIECPNYAFAEAVAVQPSDGTCPDLPGYGGTWAELFSRPPPPGYVYGQNFNGVPTLDPHWFVAPYPSCGSVMSGPCCTYVWWPVDWPDAFAPASGDPGAFCAAKTTAPILPISMYTCPLYIRDGVCGCGSPGGGGCDTCTKWGGG